MVLTVSGNSATAYLNGSQVLTAATSVMNIQNEPLNFFPDNTQSGGQGEYSTGDVALIRLYNGALSAADVAALDAGGLPGQSRGAVPEPAAVTLLGGGLLALGVALRRRAA